VACGVPPDRTSTPIAPLPATPATASAALPAGPATPAGAAPATARPQEGATSTPTLAAVATVRSAPTSAPTAANARATPSAAATESPPRGAATAAPAAGLAESELVRALASPPPARDVVDLWRRYKGQGSAVPTLEPSKERSVGDVEPFWIADSARRRYFQARARLAQRSAHFDAWVQEGERVDEAALTRSLDRLETSILPTVLRQFGGGKIAESGLRVTIVNVRLGGVVGYYSSVNEYPRAVVPNSNERPLIVMSLTAVQPGTGNYDSGLAHELQHLVQWRLDSSEETWVNEGTAELAIAAVGLRSGGNLQTFRQRPNTQLTHWAEQLGDSPAHYGAAHLFFAYVAERRGGYPFVGEILARPERGPRGVDAALRAQGSDLDGTTFERLFLDWVVANWADAPEAAQGRWGYRDAPRGRAREERLEVPTQAAVSVNQYAARYYTLPSTAVGKTVSLTQRPEVKLVAAGDRPTPFWWSSRGDGVNSRLTRELDLTAVKRATLRFKTWYDLELDFDYGFVSVSDDGGRTWSTLPARRTTTADPNGANFGQGLTGKSEGWMDEEVDLSGHVGKRVQVRFEMVTDDAYNGGGWCLDAVEVPEVGWRDEPGAPGWQVEGFLRTANRAPQRITGQVVTVAGADVTVEPLTAGPGGRSAMLVPPLPDGARRALVVAAHTPLTIEPAEIELSLGQ
jgi:immune inhibitor A